MEQRPLLFYSCCEFEMESGDGQRDLDAGGKGKLMTGGRDELLYVALWCARVCWGRLECMEAGAPEIGS